MSIHTPGPWRLGKNSDDVVADSPSGHDDESAVEYYGGHLVAESICSRNRALIASAPELLSIAKRWVALGGQWHPDRYESEKEELLTETKALIAKATA